MGLRQFWPAHYYPPSVTLSFVRWLDLFGAISIQFLCKSSSEDRDIASILGISSDVAFRIAVSEPSFYSIYFAVTLHDTEISFVILVLIIWLSSQKILWKFPEDRWKFVEDSFHA